MGKPAQAPQAYPAPWLSSPTISSRLQLLLRLPISVPLYDYVVERLLFTVTAALDRTWEQSQQQTLETPFLRPFVQNVIQRNRVPIATVLVALAYLERSRKNLRVSVGLWACERALIGAMILANKYTNDDILSTKAWAISSTVFTSRDVVRAEREFLQVLRYDLSVTEEELVAHHLPLLAKVQEFAAYHMIHTKTVPHRAAVRYSPYQSGRPSVPESAHRRKTVIRDATSSSESLSPLDSPPLRTPPDLHPYSLPIPGSDPKRTHHPHRASLIFPYVPAGPSYDPARKAPMDSLCALSMPTLRQSSALHVIGSGKDLGYDLPTAPAQPPTMLPGIRLQELDANRPSSEVRPYTLGAVPSYENVKFPSLAAAVGVYQKPLPFALESNWFLHREQATPTPPSFENTPVYV